MRQSKSSSKLHCQVPGCKETLCKGYFVTKRICPLHAKAPVVMLDGREMRFCQQCGKFHELQAFKGKKRSCMAKLDKRKEVYAALQAAAACDEDETCMSWPADMLPMAVAPVARPTDLQLCLPAFVQLQQQHAVAIWRQQQQLLLGALDSCRHSCSQSSKAWQPPGNDSPTSALRPASHCSVQLPPPQQPAEASSSSEAATSSCSELAATAAADAAAGGATASEASLGSTLSSTTAASPPSTEQPLAEVWRDDPGLSYLSSWSEQDLDGLLDDMLQPVEACGALPATSKNESDQPMALDGLWPELELPPVSAAATSPHTASSSCCSKPQSTADWAVLLSDMLADGDGEGSEAAAAGDNSADSPPPPPQQQQQQQQQGEGGAGPGAAAAACNQAAAMADAKQHDGDKDMIRKNLASLKSQFAEMHAMILAWEAKLEQSN